MEVKTSELTGHALNWAVAKCEGEEAELNQGEIVTWKTVAFREYRLVWNPSTDWAQGGAIIEREGISLYLDTNNMWQANIFDGNPICNPFGGVEGSTSLIAAMRCYVASKLGDEVEIPEELR